MADPLAPPESGSRVLALFLDHFRVDPRLPPERLVAAAAGAFAAVPYENLTKILKQADCGSPEPSRRGPLEVLADHVVLGAGGTCFSLTAAFLHVVRALGFRAEPILADRHYGADTHCALLVWIGGAPHLVDPGFLVHRPVPIGGRDGPGAGSAETRLEMPFQTIRLVPRNGGSRIDLYTGNASGASPRLTFKTEPADPGRFLKAWDTSFSWEMMDYPLLARVRDGKHVYLQDSRLQVRGRDGTTREEVPPAELAATVAREFGIAAPLAAKALRVLSRRR